MVALASLLSAALYAVSAFAAPNPQTASSQTLTSDLQFSSTPGFLPLLTLPYGIWRAASYDSINDVCLST
jgi:hypothetical protein